MTEPLRIEFVAGVTPDKWLRTWARRRPDDPVEAVAVADDPALTALREGTVSMSLVRLPVDRSGIHLIPLYEEVPVVVVPRDHPVAAFDEVDVADLADEVLAQTPEEVPEWLAVASPEALRRTRTMPPMSARDVIAVVATGAGIAIVPMSIARLHHRKDVVHRPVSGVAPCGVGLAWRVDDLDPRIEDFVGIVRGRTERSSRGTSAQRHRGTAKDPTTGAPTSRREKGTRSLPQRGAVPRKGSRAAGAKRRRGKR
jgi:DNA-binding transcriptional LysR family regulator